MVDNWTGLTFGLIAGAILALLIAVYRWVARSAEARRQRRRAMLGERPDADDRRLPLNGIDNGGRYADFDDFDDTPTSSRWYENEPTRDADFYPAEHPHADDGDHTQVMPRYDEPTRSSGERRHPDDPDSTQIIPRNNR